MILKILLMKMMDVKETEHDNTDKQYEVRET